MNKLTAPTQLSLVDDAPVNAPPTVERAKKDLVDAVLASVGGPSAPDDGFDWADDDSIVLKEQRATAIYHNKAGEVIIRQKAAWDDDQDVFVMISPENANTFLDGLADRLRKG
jgi:hypothetical protein